MITRLVPRKVKDWIRDRVSPLPIDLMKYFPYQASSYSWFISKTPAAADLCSQGLPIPPPSFFINYKTSENYLEWGRKDVGKMLDILNESGRALKAGERVLDFGCSGGRMIRWLRDYSANCEIWGTDISAEHIIWCRQYLSPHFNFLTSTTLPHLPFEDRYFDLIYSGSVFTHIEDLADAWLLEMRRILKPGGRLYVTIHDGSTIRILERERDHALSKALLADEKYREYVKADYGMFTIWRGPNSQVFYDLDYFCRMVSSTFNVISATPEAYGYQTAVVLEKK